MWQLHDLISRKRGTTINFSFGRREIATLATLLALSFVLRLLLFPIPGYTNDMITFEAWFRTAADNGLRRFYSLTTCDYPAFNVYFFWGFGSLAKALSLFGTPQIAFMVKLVPAIFDVAAAFLIFVFIRSRLDFRMALVAAAFYAFNPAVVYNSAVWGQFDAIYTFFLVLSLMLALASKPELSAVTYTLGVLTKPQAIALLPLVAYLILRKGGWRRFVTSLAAGAITVFIVILPFEWSNPVTFLANNYFFGYNRYAYTSVNAFNLWALGGLWVPDTQVTFIVGWSMFATLAIFALYVLHERFDTSGEMLAVFTAFILFFGFFMLPTRIHERYLFPALSALALMVPFAKKTRLIYATLTGTCFVNLAYILYFLNINQALPSGDFVGLAVTLINVAMFVYVLTLMWNELKRRPLFRMRSLEPTNGIKKEEGKE
jgi:Gpi18-like mannosyltransferase